jgi:hypothetical protein
MPGHTSTASLLLVLSELATQQKTLTPALSTSPQEKALGREGERERVLIVKVSWWLDLTARCAAPLQPTLGRMERHALSGATKTHKKTPTTFTV